MSGQVITEPTTEDIEFKNLDVHAFTSAPPVFAPPVGGFSGGFSASSGCTGHSFRGCR